MGKSFSSFSRLKYTMYVPSKPQSFVTFQSAVYYSVIEHQFMQQQFFLCFETLIINSFISSVSVV